MSSTLSSPEISVVIPALNEGDYLRRTVSGFLDSLPPRSEVLVVDDGSTDGSTAFLDSAGPSVRRLRTPQIGCARARNEGARQARGAVIIFADAHLEIPARWHDDLLAPLSNPRVGAVGPAITVLGGRHSKGFGLRVTGSDLGVAWLAQRGRSPYPVPLLGGAFLAMRRQVFLETGGFDEGLIRWGSNDLELCLRLWLSGYQCWLAPQVEVAHLFRKKHPYEINWTLVLHNLLRVAVVHLGPERLARVVEALKSRRGFASALALLVQGDAWQRRTALSARRVHNDDWFFNSFGIVC